MRSYAQKAHHHNININTGLPSNHVYMTMTDKYGYLWIATTKGVLQYNGYKLKLYSKADGMSNDDVWMLVEDKYDKIWLGSISNQLGYIWHDKYHVLLSKQIDKYFYPRMMTTTDSGIAFMQYSTEADKMNIQLYLVNNNKVKVYYHKDPGNDRHIRDVLTEKAEWYYLYNDKRLYQSDYVQKKLKYKCIVPELTRTNDSAYIFDNAVGGIYYYYYNLNGCVYFLNIENCSVDKFCPEYIKDEWLISVSVNNKYTIHVRTNKRIFVLDKQTHLLKEVMLLADLVSSGDIATAELVHCNAEPLWNKVVATSNKGMYLLYNNGWFVNRDTAGHFLNMQYIGSGARNTQVWWSKANKKLIFLDSAGKLLKLLPTTIYLARHAFPYSGKDTTVILTSDGYRYISHKDYVITRPFGNISKVKVDHGTDADTATHSASLHSFQYSRDEQILMIKGDTIYSRFQGTVSRRYCVKDTAYAYYFYHTNDKAATIDTASMQVYSYSSNSIRIVDLKSGIQKVLTKKELSELGIRNISRILIDDRYGNIIIQCDAGLKLFNQRSGTFISLPVSVRSDMYAMEVQYGNIILASEYGVVFFRITGAGRVIGPYYAPNHKYSFYRYVEGTRVHVTNDYVYLNTDKGFFKVHVPDSTTYTAKRATFHRMLLKYNNNVFRFNNRDTIRVYQDNLFLQFDIINPGGIGTPQYYYRIDGVQDDWRKLNADELYLQDVPAGRYHNLELRTQDDVWQSGVVHLKLYIVPRWWQTTFGRVIIAISVLGGLIMLVWLVSRITKRIVDRNNARKNMQQEINSLRTAIELKSIHSQINPHFIFNTLSTGLYFIKKKRMEDAYEHITAFSELLRAYIKSSRDKYIMLVEEIDNLKRYVLLQQSRFESLFEFDVKVADDVNIYDTKIPALLLQPIIENAINHGLFHKESPGYLLLSFEKNADGALVCIIDDNGIGREQSRIINEETKHKTQSYGTDLIKELIEIFNKYEAVQIDIQYIDKILPETGTTVKVTIKHLDNDK